MVGMQAKEGANDQDQDSSVCAAAGAELMPTKYTAPCGTRKKSSEFWASILTSMPHPPCGLPSECLSQQQMQDHVAQQRQCVKGVHHPCCHAAHTRGSLSMHNSYSDQRSLLQ
jgi:hypothetical protein